MAHIHQVVEALNWELFCEKRPSVDKELVYEFYVNLTSNFKNDEYSSLISNIEPENLQEILEELTVPGSKWTISKQGIHTCRREYLTPIAKDPEEEEEDPTEFELAQSAEVLDKVEPMDREAKPNIETSMFRAQLTSPDLRDELSNLMDIMQHMQWQQQAY
ncbi:hypothetical protein J1N35_022681 [Gossypium stocksii]|uniref:Uncharacterized protein n=1 Tax=Gossypium stocksii TaxID=47602 RepID=A0A9D3VGX6_9ROSI|nr:hypothetical protein J1N35_022681 [Gossypium stocksii]